MLQPKRAREIIAQFWASQEKPLVHYLTDEEASWVDAVHHHLKGNLSRRALIEKISKPIEIVIHDDNPLDCQLRRISGDGWGSDWSDTLDSRILFHQKTQTCVFVHSRETLREFLNQ